MRTTVNATTRYPSAGDPIAVLRAEPDQFANALRVTFRTAYDDLDWIRIARIRTADGRSFALVRHRHAPQAGTEIVATAPSTRPWADILAVLERLKLTEKDLVWRHPAAKPTITRTGNGARKRSRTFAGRAAAAKKSAHVVRNVRTRRSSAAVRKK